MSDYPKASEPVITGGDRELTFVELESGEYTLSISSANNPNQHIRLTAIELRRLIVAAASLYLDEPAPALIDEVVGHAVMGKKDATGQPEEMPLDHDTNFKDLVKDAMRELYQEANQRAATAWSNSHHIAVPPLPFPQFGYPGHHQ